MTRNDTIASLAVNSWINRDRVVWPDANLFGANLSKADLSKADLRGADLRGANMPRADLYGANLSEADLFGANLSGARITLGNHTFTLTGETAR